MIIDIKSTVMLLQSELENQNDVCDSESGRLSMVEMREYLRS